MTRYNKQLANLLLDWSSDCKRAGYEPDMSLIWAGSVKQWTLLTGKELTGWELCFSYITTLPDWYSIEPGSPAVVPGVGFHPPLQWLQWDNSAILFHKYSPLSCVLSTRVLDIGLSFLTATEKSIIVFWWYKSCKVKSKNQIPDRAQSFKDSDQSWRWFPLQTGDCSSCLETSWWQLSGHDWRLARDCLAGWYHNWNKTQNHRATLFITDLSGQLYHGGSQRNIPLATLCWEQIGSMINKSDHKTNYRKNLLLK